MGVKEAGSITYPSEVPLARQIGATNDAVIPDLKALVEGPHENDVYAVARIATFQDDVPPYARPDLAVLDSVTGEPWLTYQGTTWANPYRRYGSTTSR